MTFEEIKKLMKQFDDSSLSELQYEQDGTSLTLKKAGESHPVYTQPMMVHPHAMPLSGAPSMAMAPGDQMMADSGAAGSAPVNAGTQSDSEGSS